MNGTGKDPGHPGMRWLLLALPFALGLGLATPGCNAPDELSDELTEEEQAEAAAVTLPPCSSVCKTKEDCNAGCTQGTPAAATTCASSGASVCKGPDWEPTKPGGTAPPGNGPNACPSWENLCVRHGPSKLVGTYNTSIVRRARPRPTNPDDPPPEDEPSELTPVTSHYFLEQYWILKTPHSPGCTPVRCCDRVRVTAIRRYGGQDGARWGDTSGRPPTCHSRF